MTKVELTSTVGVHVIESPQMFAVIFTDKDGNEWSILATNKEKRIEVIYERA